MSLETESLLDCLLHPAQCAVGIWTRIKTSASFGDTHTFIDQVIAEVPTKLNVSIVMLSFPDVWRGQQTYQICQRQFPILEVLMISDPAVRRGEATVISRLTRERGYIDDREDM